MNHGLQGVLSLSTFWVAPVADSMPGLAQRSEEVWRGDVIPAAPPVLKRSTVWCFVERCDRLTHRSVALGEPHALLVLCVGV